MNPPVRIGISACLLGEAVRFDGGHKRDAFLTGTFGRFVEWVPVCPEVECGFGTPREPMRLVRSGRGVRLITVKTGVDLTTQLDSYSSERVSALASENLSGYVLKKDSPSCGLERVKVYDANKVPDKTGRGLFASRLVERFPDLPVAAEIDELGPFRRRQIPPHISKSCLRARCDFGSDFFLVRQLFPSLGARRICR